MFFFQSWAFYSSRSQHFLGQEKVSYREIIIYHKKTVFFYHSCCSQDYMNIKLKIVRNDKEVGGDGKYFMSSANSFVVFGIIWLKGLNIAKKGSRR